MKFRAKIYSVNYDSIPCTIDYLEYNFAQTPTLPNDISFAGDQIVKKIKVDFGGGIQYRPKVGDLVNIEIDENGLATAHPLDFTRAITLENDGDIVISNFLNNTSVLCHKNGVTINANNKATITLDSSTNNISISSNNDISISSTNNISISSNNDISISSTNDISINPTNKLELKNASKNLLTILTTLITALSALKTGPSPSSSPYVLDSATVTALNTAKTDLEALLK